MNPIPVKRLLLLKEKNPKFISQKQGWKKFYKQQDKFNKILKLRQDFSQL